jgi:hypothetical protein
MRGEGGAGECAQVLLDQPAQRSGPGGGGAPAAGGGFQDPPSMGGQVPGGLQGGQSGVQVSAMPGRLPLTRVAVPFFSWAIRACRAAAVLIPARAAITATAAFLSAPVRPP